MEEVVLQFDALGYMKGVCMSVCVDAMHVAYSTLIHTLAHTHIYPNPQLHAFLQHKHQHTSFPYLPHH